MRALAALGVQGAFADDSARAHFRFGRLLRCLRVPYILVLPYRWHLLLVPLASDFRKCAHNVVGLLAGGPVRPGRLSRLHRSGVMS